MKEFLHGWRRKAGIVALAIACVFATGWVRSYVADDHVWLYIPYLQSAMLSQEGRISWEVEVSNRKTFDLSYGMTSRADSLRFVALKHEMPYLLIVIPPTLLSAYLILWKPRPRPCPNLVEQYVPVIRH